MSTDVLEYLNHKGLNPKRASGTEVHVSCPYCGEDDRKRGRLYVNIDTAADIPGLHHCKLCDARGSLVSLQKFYGDATDAQEKEDRGYLRRAILAEAASYYHQALTDHEAAVRWLRHDRGLSVDTIIEHQLGFADGGLFKHLRAQGFEIGDITGTGLSRSERDSGRMTDFLNNHITIPYFVAGNVVMIRGRAFGDHDDGRKYVTPTGQKTRLFNSDATWGASEVMVTEGEFDALVATQLGYRAVACPGANVWQDAWDAYFVEARRVWVIFDRDERATGEHGATKVIDHLGPKARRVDLPAHDHGKSKNDLTEYVVSCNHTKDDLDKLMQASRGFLVTVDMAVDSFTEMEDYPGLPLGLGKIDEVVRPLLRPSQLMVVLAKTGTGKTISLVNMFYALCSNLPEAKVLFLSLEQTRAEWWDRARRIYRFYHPETFWGDGDLAAANFWRNRIWLDDRNRVSEVDLRALIEDFGYETGEMPTLLAVDYLGYFSRGFKGEPYQRTGDAVMALKAVAKEYNIPILAPHQVNRMVMHGSSPTIDSARDSGVVEETADFVMLLWSEDTQHNRNLNDRTGETKMKVGKSRVGGSGVIETFWFAAHNLALVPNHGSDQKFVQWAKDEHRYVAAYGVEEKWPEALKRHVAGLGEVPLYRVEEVLDQIAPAHRRLRALA